MKPENTLVTSDGRVKILDLGLAKLVPGDIAVAGATRTADDARTHARDAARDDGLMAPEQICGLDVDHRSDLFAFGAVLYEMFSGRRAFGGPTAADTISAILDKHPADLSHRVSAIVPALSRIVERCLEKALPDGGGYRLGTRGIVVAFGGRRVGRRITEPHPRTRVWQAAVSLVELPALSAGALAYCWWPRADTTTYRSVILPPDGVIVTDSGNAPIFVPMF